MQGIEEKDVFADVVTRSKTNSETKTAGAVTYAELSGEFLGTWLLMVFGLGVNAQVTLSGQTAGTFLSINFAWGLAVTMAAYLSASLSGGHLNPAITLALATFGTFSKRKVLPYIGAQMLGAFLGAATVYLAYSEAIGHFDGGVRQIVGAQATAGIFGTYPQAFLSTWGGLIDQILGTLLLTVMVFVFSDSRNTIPQGVAPVLVGAVVLLIGMTFGFNAGYAINPARDLGPRLFTFVGGWGPEVFTASNYWFWVPVVGPCIGALLGGGLYRLISSTRNE